MKAFLGLLWMGIFAFSGLLPTLGHAAAGKKDERQRPFLAHKSKHHSHHHHSSSSCHEPPENFAITKAFTTPGEIPLDLFGFTEILDFYENAIFDDNLYAAWADNSEGIPPDFGSSMKFRRGKLKSKKGKTDVEFGEIQTLFSPTPNAAIAEFSLTVNPTLPGNIVIGGNYITADEPLFENQLQIIRAVSFDNGDNWNVTRVDDTNGYPVSDGDQHFLFDDFGNCWLISLTGRPPNFFPNDVSIGVSTDGGITFTLVQSFFSDPNAVFGYDYPQIAFGGDGNGGFALYFTVDFIDDSGNVTPNIGFIPVSGKGSFGSVTIVPLTQFTNIFAIGVPRISRDGKIFVIGLPDLPPDFVLDPVQLIFNPGGLSNITDGSFFGPRQVAQTNFGAPVPTSAGFPINFTPKRGADPVIPRSTVYDDAIGRLYVFYADIRHPPSQDMALFVRFSDDNGLSWSDKIKISDTDEQNRTFQSIARDPITGNFFFTWYDCRNDETSASGQYFGAVVKGDCFTKKSAPMAKKPRNEKVPGKPAAKKFTGKINKDYLNGRRARSLRWQLKDRELGKKHTVSVSQH